MKGERRKKVLFVITLPIAIAAVCAGLTYAIPSWRLVESDDEPEKVTLAEECKLEGKWLVSVGQAGRPIVSGPRTEGIVQAANGSKFWRLKFPGCKLEEIPLPANTPAQAYAPLELARGGRLLYTTARRGFPLQDTGAIVDGKLVPLERFAQLNPALVSPPRISPDGGTLAWIERKPGVVKIAALGPKGLKEQAQFDLSALGAGTYDVLDPLEDGRGFLLVRNLREFLIVDRQGKTLSKFRGVHGQMLPTLKLDPPIHPGYGAIRFLTSDPAYVTHVLAWEAYKESGRYLIQWWRAPDWMGQKEIPKGRSVASADYSPDGNFIAASTAPAVSVGKIDDMVQVWSADGKLIFRKRLPPNTRAPVAFFAGNLVAYSQIDQQGHGVTHVLKLW
jgi:hypothetical protein